MSRPRTVPTDHAAFADLPVTHVSLAAGMRAAVHVAGTLSRQRPPVVCIPGYQRNMSDFSAFAAYFAVLEAVPGRSCCFICRAVAG